MPNFLDIENFLRFWKNGAKVFKKVLCMAKTLGEQLEEVQNAISAVLTSQSYKLNGRELTRADLSALEMREERLLGLIEKYGADYTAGQQAEVRGVRASVRFSS